MRLITGGIACLFVGHCCPLESIKKTGEPEDSEKRVMATCGRCGKTITAHCGLAMRTTWYRLRPLSQNRKGSGAAVSRRLNPLVRLRSDWRGKDRHDKVPN